MDEIKRHILIVEQDQVLRDEFIKAFLNAGYNVQATDRFQEAVAIVREGNTKRRPFDLALMDISDKGQLLIANALHRLSDELPVFTLRDRSDKLMIIDLLNQKRGEFLEEFIEMHVKAL